METVPVYLEVGPDGDCMAHVLDLPGCFVRAPGRDAALRRLPAAIRAHLAWLSDHGEPAPADAGTVEVRVADTVTGLGPFDPGDAAALFPPEREPISSQKMEHYFRLMAFSRADLLNLVRDLADDVLDWVPDPASYSIRRLLRHVGNAEEWYVSRLVPPETLPSEWEGDEDLPVLEFLEMERRTAAERLRQLDEEQRSAVVHPSRWTEHPEEAWTARKALRRFVEHEREHTAQVRETLSLYRQLLFDRLANARAELLGQLLGIEGQDLTQTKVLNGWTVQDVLAHIAAWDRWQHRQMERMLAGEGPDMAAVEDVDAANAAFVEAWRDRPFGEVLEELLAARRDWLALLKEMPHEAFFRRRTFEGDDWDFPGCAEVQYRHDAEHAAQIAAWRREAGLDEGGTGPTAVLLAALASAREELLSVAALVPAPERESRPVCGEWTLKDVLGHVADWERFGAEGLRLMAAGQPPYVEDVADFEGWNRRHAAARRGQPWGQVRADLDGARQSLLDALQGVSEEDLARAFVAPWGEPCTPYSWVCIFLSHEREHAEGVRESVGPSQSC